MPAGRSLSPEEMAVHRGLRLAAAMVENFENNYSPASMPRGTSGLYGSSFKFLG
jgi:hypothetical protein